MLRGAYDEDWARLFTDQVRQVWNLGINVFVNLFPCTGDCPAVLDLCGWSGQ
jgi:hypothetical protein